VTGWNVRNAVVLRCWIDQTGEFTNAEPHPPLFPTAFWAHNERTGHISERATVHNATSRSLPADFGSRSMCFCEGRREWLALLLEAWIEMKG
jgi:hypothetical protein